MRRLTLFIESAVGRLTLWYLLILTLLSLLFSIIVYGIAVNELHRPVGGPRQMSAQIFGESSDTFERYRLEREREGKENLVTGLLMFNILVISTGGLASYLLAKRTLEPIEAALEAQTRFSSDAAHELRTPLAVMQSEIEVGLRSSKPTIDTQRALLKSSLDEVGRLRQLTDRLLLLSNFSTVELTHTVLDEIVTEAINRVVPQALAKRISIDSIVGKETALAHPELITDTLVILLDNAVKYCPPKSEVKISAIEQGRHVLLQVKDNGPGIAAADLPHIFDRFYRADVSRTKHTVEGHGLGLSIAKRAAEAMHGTITATSEPQKGTTFTLKLIAG